MSECGSTRTCSSNGDGEDYRFVAGTEVAIIEGYGKYRDGKRWKPRFCVLSKLSPAADCLQLQVYRDEKEKARNGHTKASLSLQHFLAVESGFTLDKESHTLAIICQDLNVVLAFDNRERLIQWSVRIANNLGEAQQFLVQLASAPVKSKLNPGPVKLHVTDKRFCLTGGIPPKLLGAWEISQLRRYGLVDGRLVFEGGSRCGKGEGVHVLIPDPPQLSQIIEAFDSSSKGHMARGPSRRFGSVMDSPRKILGSRLSEIRPVIDTSTNGISPAYNLTMSPQPRESRSAEELCAACTDTPTGPSTSAMWASSENSSRCDLESCENLSVVGQCQQQSTVRPASPVKQTIAKPMPSAMERCLSCMSKLGQGGQLHDILSPSWTMDLSVNTNTACHNTSIGSNNSDRLSISSHGSSGGGIPEYCYDTPRSVLINEMRRNQHSNRSGTPPTQHTCCGSNSSVNNHRNCVHSSGPAQQPRCDSPHRNPLLRNGCAAHVTNCQCQQGQHHHALQQNGQGPIYYSIPEQPPYNFSHGGENKTHAHHGPYENYDFPKHSNPIAAPSSQRSCCSGNSHACSGSSSGDWIRNQPMDRSSIASSAHCSDHLNSDWYDTPKPHDSLPIYNNAPPNRSCQCCQSSNSSTNGVQCQNQDSTSSYNPLENYDVPPASALPVCDAKFIQRSQNLPGRVNGEGKMPLVTSSVLTAKTAAPNQAIYAQVDKSKKTPKPIPTLPACDNESIGVVQLQPQQPLYSNTAPIPDSSNMNKTSTKPVEPVPCPVIEKTTLISLDSDIHNQHSNYVNLNFVDSLQLYENSKEIRQQRCEEEAGNGKVELVKNMQIQKQELAIGKEIEKVAKPTSSATTGEQKAESLTAKVQENKGNPREKAESDGEVILPLRRSSSVPCKGGHANRGSASSSDSGVSGDGGLYFDDSSPSNDFGNLCLHESLPRKVQRNSPGSTAGKNPSIASTPKPQSSDEVVVYVNTQAPATDPVKVIKVEEEVKYQNGTNENSCIQVPSSPKYETIQEIEPLMAKAITSCSSSQLNKSSEPSGRRILKNPTSSLVSDANSTSSGASDMSDYIESLSSCSRGSIDIGNHSHSSSMHVHHLTGMSAISSSSPKKSTNMKPRSGKEYLKIDRSMFAKQN